VEESVVLLSVTPLFDLCVDPEVHVAVDGSIVVPYRYALVGGEELCKVAGRGRDGIAVERLVVVEVWDLVFGHVVKVGRQVLLTCRSIGVDRGAGRMRLISVAVVVCGKVIGVVAL
jgi:hypothetical protein